MPNELLKKRKVQRYGWKPQLPDHRDLMWVIPKDVVLPPSVDLRPGCPPVYDQGELGSCTANAIAAAYEYEMKLQGLPDFMPSRLFLYYNERVIEGDVDQDNGAQIRDGIKTLAKQGICEELHWPYDIEKFADRPADTCYQEALENKALVYQGLARSPRMLKACLAANRPFVFGLSVYESFESEAVAKTGVVPLPQPGESCVGGHAVLCVGYDDAKDAFLVRNSWGPGWGEQGYFWLPYEYVIGKGLASDFWTLKKVS